ncbi:MAG: hypothetical protein ACFFDF_00380 [Candidatus Odinarchaeota archaeon]
MNYGSKIFDYETEIGLDKIPDTFPYFVSGENTVVSTSQNVFINDVSTANPNGIPIALLTNAIQFKVSSTSNNDTSGGTGARNVYLTGIAIINNVWTYTSEFVTLNGQTEVLTSNSYIRLLKCEAYSVGSLGVQDGDIYIGTGVVTNGIPATEYGKIRSDRGAMKSSLLTIPDGYKGLLKQFIINIDSNKTNEIYLKTKSSSTSKVTRVHFTLDTTQNVINLVSYFAIPQRTDLWIEAKSIAQTSNVKVGLVFTLHKI